MDVEIFGYCDNVIFKYGDIWIFGYWNIKIYIFRYRGYWGIEITEYLSMGIVGYLLLNI